MHVTDSFGSPCSGLSNAKFQLTKIKYQTNHNNQIQKSKQFAVDFI
ncbi:hypothetical protein D1AOALGA4SA_7267 [Olavius algarvensis Delta 1 endosymbiont]|nr:hypothetical protein D1AOALGA4SA_7267 [Olavius algarvensis Delta 1 endosymbiont]